MSDTQTQPAPAPVSSSRGPSTAQLVIVVAILAAGLVVTASTSDVSRVSEPGVVLRDGQPFLPEKAGPWTGGELTGLTPEERAILPSDTEGARRIYRDESGHQIYCSVVLAGRDVTSIHRPELCLKGQGWNLNAPRTVGISTPAAAGGALHVSQMYASRMYQDDSGRTGQIRSVFVYWFVGKDRTTPYHWQRILWTTADRVLHNRNHRWAYFLINCAVGVGPQVAPQEAEAAQAQTAELVDRFVHDIYPSLVAK